MTDIELVIYDDLNEIETAILEEDFIINKNVINQIVYPVVVSSFSDINWTSANLNFV
jgi:hypothetical protein